MAKLTKDLELNIDEFTKWRDSQEVLYARDGNKMLMLNTFGGILVYRYEKQPDGETLKVLKRSFIQPYSAIEFFNEMNQD